MNTLAFLILSLPVLSAHAFGAEAPKGIAVEDLERALGGPVYGQSWALVIGINEYPAGSPFRPLNFAVADAEAMQDLLVRYYGFPAENVTLLLDGQATRAGILSALIDLGECSKENDRVLVYFSGHGHTVELPREGKRGYLVPYGVKLREQDLSGAAKVERECVPMTEVRQKARLMAARHILFLIDACYSGLSVSGKSPQAVPYHLTTIASRPMIGILTAGRAGEVAYEDPDLGDSAFTKKVLDALTPVAGTVLADTAPQDQPDGVITLKELAAYLTTAVPQVTQGKQNPQEAQEDDGQFLFIPTEPTRPTPPVVQPTRPTVRPEPGRGGQTKINSVDGAELVWIPGGSFLMGSDPKEIDALWAKTGWDADWKKFATHESPKHRVSVEGFWAYKHEVTNEQYG